MIVGCRYIEGYILQTDDLFIKCTECKFNLKSNECRQYRRDNKRNFVIK